VHDAQRVADARDLGGLALREVAAIDGDDAAVVHDLDLAPHLVHVLRGEQLALGDGLAGQRRARGQLRRAELPLPQRVELAQVVGRNPRTLLLLIPAKPPGMVVCIVLKM
jgi:hypothetical protein